MGGIIRFCRVGFKTGAVEDWQDRVFVEASISFGPFAHKEEAAFGALNDFDVPADGAQSDVGRELHGGEFSMEAEYCKNEQTPCLLPELRLSSKL